MEEQFLRNRRSDVLYKEFYTRFLVDVALTVPRIIVTYKDQG